MNPVRFCRANVLVGVCIELLNLGLLPYWHGTKQKSSDAPNVMTMPQLKLNQK
jgi:hypothetical protein